MRQVRIATIENAVYPVDVYIADIYGNNRTLLGTITSMDAPPPIIDFNNLPSIFQTAPEIMVILIDSAGCEKFEIAYCNTPTPTPTPTFQTPTPTPSVTVTQTQTPTNQTPTPTPSITATATYTPTPTITPSNVPFMAYIFPEPLDSTSQINLGSYMSTANGGVATWFGFGNSGVPNTSDYSTNMDIYAHYSGWTGNSGNFITPVTSLSSIIRQNSGIGVDTYGCPQNQFSFGTIQIQTSMVNPNIPYFYTIWIPLAAVNNVMNNMTVDAGVGTACNTAILDDGLPDTVLSSQNITVSIGAPIPEGIYRILWVYPQLQIPSTIPLNSSIFIRGESKT